MTTSKPPRQTAASPAEVADPQSTVRPSRRGTARTTALPKAADSPLDAAQLDAAILRQLRRFPNSTVDLQPLAAELGVEPVEVQLAVERLHRRRMVTAPFVEPSSAGGATLTQVGLRWLIEREGGSPADTPVALKPATDHVRAADDAARLPRAQVYGVSRGSTG